jgi:hypothetical protein
MIRRHTEQPANAIRFEAILNHVTGHKAGVAGVYNRASYEREKRTALALWADHVLAAVEGRAVNVVPLRA